MARLLLLFGAGFLAANLLLLSEQVRYWRRRRGALLTWPGKRPPLFLMQVGIGIALGILLAYDLLVRPGAAEQAFGVGMMFVYYALAVPMSARIERGFYGDGIWSDRRFVRYSGIGAISWREDAGTVLVIASRDGKTATLLSIPGPHLGAVRRLLRDLIGRHSIHLADTGLHLGLRDERDDV